jgi:hypothetical protein
MIPQHDPAQRDVPDGSCARRALEPLAIESNRLDRKRLQLLNLERFLIDPVNPPDQKAL